MEVKMAVDILTTQRTKSATPATVSSLGELAKTIRASAVAEALSDRRSYASNEALLELELSRPAVREAVKDGIARGVARALAAHDEQVQAIYGYDPSANPDSEAGDDRLFDATIHLLALVTAPSAALQAFIAALDRALTESLRQLPCPPFQIRESVLDINLITRREVQEHKGYAGLLSATFAPAIEVWHR
jgi:hypothetical protein